MAVQVPLAGSSPVDNVASRPRSQKAWVRDRALLGCGSLPEREWDHANGYKQNQKRRLEEDGL